MKQSTKDILELTDGHTITEIAKILDRKYQDVYFILRYYGKLQSKKQKKLYNYHSVILLDRIWWVGFTYQDEHYFCEGVAENKSAAFDAIRDFRESVIRRV